MSDEKTKGSVVKVVLGDDLEQLTQEGWEIVSEFQEDCAFTYTDSPPVNEAGCRTGMPGATKTAVGNRRRFMLKLNLESALAKNKREIETLRASVHDLDQKLRTEVRAKHDIEYKRLELERKVKSLETFSQDQGERSTELYGLLGRIKDRVGTTRYDKLIAEPRPKAPRVRAKKLEMTRPSSGAHYSEPPTPLPTKGEDK